MSDPSPSPQDPPSPSLPAALEAGLARLVPDEADTHLLRTLLLDGSGAAQAWSAFRAEAGDLPSLFRADTGGRKRLGPLLARAIRVHALDATPDTLTVLRTAQLREELRDRAYEGILADALAAVIATTLSPILVGGAALRHLVYEEPALRHAHHVELLAAPGQARAVTDALVSAGLGARTSPRAPSGVAARVRHSTGVPLLVRTDLYDLDVYGAGAAGVRERSRKGTVAGHPVAVPAVADALVHVLGRASHSKSRASLVWAVDAARLAREDRMDWSAVEAHAIEACLTLPVFVMLRFLRDALAAPVPISTLDRLARAAERSTPLLRDVALLGARQAPGRGGRRGANMHAPPPAAWPKLRAAGWQLVPSRAYLDWAHDRPGPAERVALYAWRPLSWAARRLRWALVRTFRRRG